MGTMPYDDLLVVKIFKQEPNSSCDPSCTLNTYTRDRTPAPNAWHMDPNSNWPTGVRVTQEPTDPIGVEIQFRHRFLVNLISGAVGTTIIRDHSVVQIEPDLRHPDFLSGAGGARFSGSGRLLMRLITHRLSPPARKPDGTGPGARPGRRWSSSP